MTPPTLLFLPGAGGAAAFWEPLVSLLPAAWPKHLLSWPGLGNQPPDATIRGFDDLVCLTESHLAGSPVDLIAHSMGGAVAIAVALRNPERIRRLVLTATSGGIDISGLACEDWRPAYRAEFPNAARWISEVHPNVEAKLPALLHPTLLLWGDADPISPVAVRRRLQKLLPHATLSIIPGADHRFANTRAREIAAPIIHHLA